MPFICAGCNNGATLLPHLRDLLKNECRHTAEIVAHIAEVDRRKLYLREGFPSMYLYCVEGLHLSEAAAYKRIHAARAARKCPEILTALADGRAHLSNVCLLAPYITPKNGPALLAEATHRRRFEVKEMLARHFPVPDRLDVDMEVRPLDPRPGLAIAASGSSQLAPGPVAGAETRQAGVLLPDALGPAAAATQLAPGAVPGPIEVPGSLGPGAPASRGVPFQCPREATPLAPDRYELRFVIDRETHELLERAQDLLSPLVPSRSIPELFRRSLVALISQAERRKVGVGARARTAHPGASAVSVRNRYIPASIRRAVWEKSGGRCVSRSENGRRCETRQFLEFDHIVPVAKGGKSTVDNIRLLCRAHNQYEAEMALGAEFMQTRRERSRAEARKKKLRKSLLGPVSRPRDEQAISEPPARVKESTGPGASSPTVSSPTASSDRERKRGSGAG